VNIFNGRLYHEVAISSREECNKLSKMTHFVTTTEEMLVKELEQLFRNNKWKLYKLLESVILDRRP